MDLYDLWTRSNQWLTISDIVGLLRLNRREDRARIGWIMWELRDGVKSGVFRRRKVWRRIKRVIPNRKTHYMRRKVYSYSPAPWVLRSVCDGFYEKNLAKHTQHGRFLFQISEEGM